MVFDRTNEQVIKYSTNCEDIVVICYSSSRSAVSFVDQCKYILTKNFFIPGKFGRSKMEKL